MIKNKDGIIIYDDVALKGIKKSCEIASKTLDMISTLVEPGITTQELNQACHDFIVSKKSTPATLGYRGYPKSCCISLNHIVCHGIPGDKKVKNGDILNIDVTCILDGWYGDTSRMYTVGDVSLKSKRLIEVTYHSLLEGIKSAKPGNTFGDIGANIQNYVEKNKMSVVRDFCGHGIGNEFHQAPNVLHYGVPGTGPVLQPGMCFTIEPMVNLGRPETKILSDNWTAVTRDKSLSAQFEHTVFISEGGCEILTNSFNDSFFPEGAKLPHSNA
ncbi:type I methionyl aminopeptidase [Paracoccaceae bacterium]|nr:type I methionyl aminopeptidase [Paracoccaceae bacterium]